MTLGVTNDENYNDIADALREVGVGMSDATFTPSQMAPAIRGLRSIWGNIEGQLANQSDLQNALNAKANSADLGDMAAEDDAPSDDKQYGRKNGDWVPITDELANWGQIAGTLSDQTDLQDALDLKANLASPTFTGMPKAPTAVNGLDSSKQIATNQFVQNAIELKTYQKWQIDQNFSNLTKMLANYEISLKATRDYSVGDIVAVKNNKLYICLEDIVSGDDLVVDENVSVTTVEELLSALKKAVDDKLALKADADSVYTKTETDTLLDAKADAATGHLSGSIVSFNDGADSAFVKDLSVSIEPVQDLHGYDNPWPAGGGKNLYDVSNYPLTSGWINYVTGAYSASESYACTGYIPVTLSEGTIITLNHTPGGTYPGMAFYDSSKNVISGSGGKGNAISIPANCAYMRFTVPVDYASGSDVQIELGSTATSYAPYSNICPISGWDEAVVTRTGKNLLNPSNNTEGKAISADGTISSLSQACYTELIPVNSGDTYIFSAVSALSGQWNRRIHGYDNFGNWVVNINSISTSYAVGTAFSLTATIPNNVMFVRVSYFNDTNPQFNLSSTIQTVTIDLDGTRYGGTLDVTTGMLTVDRAIVDLGTLNWGTYNQTYKVWDSSDIKSLVKSPSVAGDLAEIVSDTYKNVTWNNLYGNRLTPNHTGITIGSVSSTTNAGKIRVRTGSDVITPTGQLVYKLKSPVTVPLAPAQMQTLLGENNIWADTGDVEVTYCKDTETYVASEINAYHDDTKATVITETASGSIASFMDGSTLPVAALSVGIEPAQDLHGYDHPWPNGGNVNLISDVHNTSNGFLDREYIKDDGSTVASDGYCVCEYVPCKPSTIYTCKKYTNAQSIVVAICFYDSEKNFLSGEAYNNRTSYQVTSPANAAFFRTNFDRLETSVSPKYFMVVEGTETPETWLPYSNICPISGWDEVNVYRSGTNLFDFIKTDETRSGLIATPNIVNGATENLTITGTASQAYAINIGTALLKRGKTYIFTYKLISSDGENGQYRVYRTSSFGGGLIFHGMNLNDTYSYSYTPTKDETVWVSFGFSKDIYYNVTFLPMLQIEEGTLSEPEPSKSASVTISLGEERYGGTLDVTTGMLTIDRVMQTFTETAGGLASSGNAFVRFGNDIYKQADSGLSNYLAFKKTAQANLQDGEFSVYSGQSNVVYFRISSALTTRAEYDAYMSQNPLQLCLPLASPFTVQLTPSQLSTLLGENHIFADTGDVTATYRADSKMYIDQKVNEAVRKTKQIIAAVTDTMVVPSNLTAGDFIIVGDDLLKATSNIASGATLTIGSNCVKTTVAEALIALASA